jgi:hypothetical protein
MPERPRLGSGASRPSALTQPSDTSRTESGARGSEVAFSASTQTAWFITGEIVMVMRSFPANFKRIQGG